MKLNVVILSSRFIKQPHQLVDNALTTHSVKWIYHPMTVPVDFTTLLYLHWIDPISTTDYVLPNFYVQPL